jgi:hypothetical protein
MSLRGFSVLPVRPYARHIRVRVFSLLRSVGLEIDETNAIPAGTRDDEVIARLRRLSASAGAGAPWLRSPVRRREPHIALLAGRSVLACYDPSPVRQLRPSHANRARGSV